MLRPPRTVSASISAPSEVRPGDTVTLTATAESAGTVTGFLWAQVGSKDVLGNPKEGPTLQWVAPMVATPTAYTFKVQATDDYGTRDIQTVVVPVVPPGMSWTPAAPPPSQNLNLWQRIKQGR
jgi:hypothetical protein